jgi:hypothetical protein
LAAKELSQNNAGKGSQAPPMALCDGRVSKCAI